MEVKKGNHLVGRVWMIWICDFSKDVQKVVLHSLCFSWGEFGVGAGFGLFADGMKFGEVGRGRRSHNIMFNASKLLKIDLKNWRYLSKLYHKTNYWLSEIDKLECLHIYVSFSSYNVWLCRFFINSDSPFILLSIIV